MYKIIDNFLPKETQDELEEALTSYKYSMSVGTVYEEYRKTLPFLKTLPKSEVIQFESKIVAAGSCIFPEEEEIYFRQIWNAFVKANIKDVVCNLSTSNDLVLIRMKSNVLLIGCKIFSSFTVWELGSAIKSGKFYLFTKS